MNNTRELKIVIKADGSVAVNEIKLVGQSTDELEKQLREARQEMNRLALELDKMTGTAKGTDAEVKKLKGDSAALASENKQLRQEVERVQAEFAKAAANAERLEKEVNDLGKELDKCGRNLNTTDRATQNIGKSTKGASREVERFKVSWTDLATGINQAWDILDKTKRTLDAGWDFAKQGARFREARDSFEDYTRSIGKNSTEILNKLRLASGGTISEMDLVVTASKAMSLGVTKDAGQMANLLQIARNKARLFGMETSQAFEDIVTGIGRGSPLILDNLGIRIPAGFEKMTEGMTDVEKTAKLLELTLAEGNKQLKEMGGLSNSGADEMRAFEASIRNLKNEFGELISKAFNPFVADLRETVIPAAEDAIYIIRNLADETKISGEIFARHGIAGQIAKNEEAIASLEKQRKELAAIMQTPLQLFQKDLDKKYNLNIQLKEDISDQEIRNAIQGRIREINLQLISANKDLEKSRGRAYAESVFKNLEKDQKDADEACDALDRLSRELDKNTDKKKKNASAAREVKESYIGLLDAITAQYQMNRKILPTIENLEGGLLRVVSAMEDMIDNTGASGTELLKIPFLEVAEQAAELANNIDMVKEAMGSGFDKASMSMARDAVNYLQKGVVGYFDFMSAGQQRSMWDAYGGNILSTIWNSGSDPQEQKQKENLSQTIAEAVSTGFANADFSNFSLTLGNVLSNILSKSVSTQFPVLNAGGGINLGNLGINLATSAITSFITRPGRFFGGTEIHGQENVNLAQSKQSELESLWSKLNDYYYNPLVVGAGQWNQLKNFDTASRGGFGYQGNKSGDGIFSDKTITYELLDFGGSQAIKNLTEFMRSADMALAATDYAVKTWQNNQDSRYYSEMMRWYDQPLAEAKRTAGNSPEAAKKYFDLQYEYDSLKREFDSLKVSREDRGFQIAMEYGGYGPNRSDSVASSEWMSKRKWYGNELVNTVIDRDNVPVQPIVSAINNKFQQTYDLAELNIKDPEEYAKKYNEYLKNQEKKYQDLAEYELTIINDMTASLEEREAAISRYEQALAAHHQAKLDQLAIEQQQEEELERKRSEQRQAQIESTLSLVGELNQRQNGIVIIQGGDTTQAIKALMEEFADNPEVTAILQSSLTNAETKARWGN